MHGIQKRGWGLAAAFWTVELLASLTHGMPPRDAFAFTVAPPLLIGIASLAAARPAWTVTKTGVLDLLRE